MSEYCSQLQLYGSRKEKHRPEYWWHEFASVSFIQLTLQTFKESVPRISLKHLFPFLPWTVKSVEQGTGWHLPQRIGHEGSGANTLQQTLIHVSHRTVFSSQCLFWDIWSQKQQSKVSWDSPPSYKVSLIFFWFEPHPLQPKSWSRTCCVTGLSDKKMSWTVQQVSSRLLANFFVTLTKMELCTLLSLNRCLWTFLSRQNSYLRKVTFHNCSWRCISSDKGSCFYQKLSNKTPQYQVHWWTGNEYCWVLCLDIKETFP